MNTLIVGGYGSVGRTIARELAAATDAPNEVSIAGRDGTKANVLAAAIGGSRLWHLVRPPRRGIVRSCARHCRPSAPPLMLLDEPFVHLDDLNTLSFFNLVIELAVRGDRQIVFATANDNLASLLERKVGETEAFERVDLENRR